MGPRSDDRGNFLGSIDRSIRQAELQWGRDQMIAEISPSATTTYVLTAPLQWGRDQMIAEMSMAAEGRPMNRPASMGPRSDDRGNAARYSTARSAADWLQWGRDQMIAEITAPWGNVQIYGVLQWGRDQMIAEIERSALTS